MMGARYFITMVTKDRSYGLSNSPVRDEILNAWRVLHKSNDFEFYCGTVMPDHVHCIFKLGARLELARLSAKFKSLTRKAVKEVGLQWQENYFDHRIRPDVSIEQFARYVFLNPYRKGLISFDEEWSGWVLNRNHCPEFIEHLRHGKYPQAEWLANEVPLVDLIQDSVESGEM
jgi:REP element-mobilizing transposase RayT